MAQDGPQASAASTNVETEAEMGSCVPRGEEVCAAEAEHGAAGSGGIPHGMESLDVATAAALEMEGIGAEAASTEVTSASSPGRGSTEGSGILSGSRQTSLSHWLL